MNYIDGSAPLSEEEVEDLNDLPNGSVPVKTEGGFAAATLADVPDSTAGAGRAAVTTNEKTAVAALAALSKGELRSVATVTQGTNGDLLAYDSAQASGFIPITKSEVFRQKHAWYTMTGLGLDFANGFCQRLVLANGVNAFTGMINAVPGITYKLKLVQPAADAAGTITLTPTSPNVVKVAGSLALSPTNGKTNYLFLTYDDTGNGEFSAFVSQEF